MASWVQPYNVYSLNFCFFLFQVHCDDASDELGLVDILDRDRTAADDEDDDSPGDLEDSINKMYKSNKTNGIVEEVKVDGGGVKGEPGHNLTVVEQQKQPPNIGDANKSLLTGQPPSSSCDCLGLDDGDLPGIIIFGKLLKNFFVDKIPDGLFYLGVLASKKIADETRKFCKERARKADTTLCNFTMQRLRDYFWLDETRANNEDDGGDIPAGIELTEKSLMKRKKIEVERVTAVAAAVNKSITTTTTTDIEKVAKKKDGTGGSTESLPPLPLNKNGNTSSDDDL